MNHSETENLQNRVRLRAKKLWEEDGRREAGSEAYVDRAREQLAIGDNQHSAAKPIDDVPRDPLTHEPIEPIEALKNQGEFPTLTDQGEEPAFPNLKP